MGITFSKYKSFQTEVDKTYFPIRGYTISEHKAKKQYQKDGKIDFEIRGFFYDYNRRRWIFFYPQEFMNPSEHGKYIVFQYCRCSFNDHFNSIIEVLASFIP